MNINESPVFLLLDDNISAKHKNLPVNLYESGRPFGPQLPAVHRLMLLKLLVQQSVRHCKPFHTVWLAELHTIDGHPQSVFVESKYKIEVALISRSPALVPCTLQHLAHSCLGSQRHQTSAAEPGLILAVQTSEAERIGINQIAKVLPRGSDKSSDQRELRLQSGIAVLSW